MVLGELIRQLGEGIASVPSSTMPTNRHLLRGWNRRPYATAKALVITPRRPSSAL